MEILRVSGRSRPNLVAGAIAALLRSQREVSIQAIGPHAVNQAVKAMAICRGYITPDRLDLVCVPAFVDIAIEDEQRTGVRFTVRAAETREAGPVTSPPIELDPDAIACGEQTHTA